MKHFTTNDLNAQMEEIRDDINIQNMRHSFIVRKVEPLDDGYCVVWTMGIEKYRAYITKKSTHIYVVQGETYPQTYEYLYIIEKYIRKQLF